MNDSFHPRRRWPWMLLLLAALLALFIGGGYGVWSAGAKRRLNFEVARLRAAGEPMELSDFVVTNVADADNAALDLRAAALSIDSTTQHFKDYDKLEPAIPLTDAEVRGISDAVNDNAAAFAGVERAITKKGVDWQIAFKSPAVQILLPDLSHMRELANLVGYRALLEHQQGNDAAALRDVDHLLFIADAVDQQPTLVSHLVATGIRAIVANRIEQIAPDLKIGTSNGAASLPQVRSLIAKLLDERTAVAGQHRAFQGERAIELDAARCIADGRMSLAGVTSPGPSTSGAAAANVAVSIIGGPMFLADGLLMIQQTTKLMQAVDHSPNWPAYRAAAPPMPPEMMQSPFRHVLARIMMPSFDRAIQTHFRSSADRRMTAVALAIACYRAEHGGKFPATLDELIPAELAAIPADPMSAAGKIKYVAATTQPIVYSIGEDGIDNGGSEASTTNRPVRSGWDMQDAVLHLTLQKRPPPADDDTLLSGVDAENLPPVTTQATSEPATSPASQRASKEGVKH